MAINLKQLAGLFKDSAATEELPMPIRKFASQLALLVRHVARQDAHIAELTNLLLATQESAAAGAPAAAPQAAAPSAPVVESGEDESDDEEKATQAMIADAMRHMEEADEPVKAPTPIRKPSANGGVSKDAS